jgi:hypothetical protein
LPKNTDLCTRHETRLWTEAIADPDGQSLDAFKYRYFIFLKAITDERLKAQLDVIKTLNTRLEVLATRSILATKRSLESSQLKTLEKIR